MHHGVAGSGCETGCQPLLVQSVCEEKTPGCGPNGSQEQHTLDLAVWTRLLLAQQLKVTQIEWLRFFSAWS